MGRPAGSAGVGSELFKAIVKLSTRIVSFAIAALVTIGDVEVQAVTLEDLSATVAYLKEGDKTGTGFFVVSESPGNGTEDEPYLVTASHVAEFLTLDSKITVRAQGDIPVEILLKHLIPGTDKLTWKNHDEADVAVLRLKLDSSTLPLMQGRFLNLNLIVADESAPQRERPVTVMGFPLALGTTGRFSPLTSEAKPASGLLRVPRGDTRKEATFFVLDKPSVGGFSGGPVFLMPGPYSSSAGLVFQGKPAQTTVVGLVHGTMSDNTGGKLALITPAKFIRDTILKPDQAEKNP